MLQGEFDIDERPKTVQPQLAAAQYVELPSAQANVRSAQGVVQAAVTHEKTLRNFYRAKVINAVYLRRFWFKTIFLPRQARDNHGESTPTNGVSLRGSRSLFSTAATRCSPSRCVLTYDQCRS
jgi:hypothetical protein